MKILQVITSLWTGGAEKLVVQLTHALKERGHSVDVALFDGTKTDLKKELEKWNKNSIKLTVQKKVDRLSPEQLEQLNKYLDGILNIKNWLEL